MLRLRYLCYNSSPKLAARLPQGDFVAGHDLGGVAGAVAVKPDTLTRFTPLAALYLRQEKAAMPYCPDCLTEYVEGTRKCEDCGALLVPGSPPAVEEEEASKSSAGQAIGGWFRSLVGAGPERDSPEVKMVRIRTFSGPTASLDADLARNLLRARGIPSILPGETSVEMLPFLEVPLLVREEDAERAKGILSEYLDKSGPGLVR
jgi:hypothetical protein